MDLDSAEEGTKSIWGAFGDFAWIWRLRRLELWIYLGGESAICGVSLDRER